jgi:GNAT superfamily N-acetyltransferase
MELEESHAQYRKAWRQYALAVPGSEVVERPEVYITAGHVSWAILNKAFLTRPAPTHQALEAAVSSAARYFSAGRNMWMFAVSDDWLAPDVRPAAPALLAGYGLKPVMTLTGMVAGGLLEPRGPLPLLDVRPVRDTGGRQAVADINAVSYDVTKPMGREALDHERLYGPACRGFVGYRDGVPVSSTSVMPIDGVAYIGLVATLPEHRRMGAAETVMRHALAEARREWGVERTVLHATEAGYPVYLRMGYRPVTRFQVYLAPAPGAA